MIIDAIEEDVFYYPFRPDLKPDYKLNRDNQKMQCNDKKFYTSEERPKNTASKFNKLIINEEKGLNDDLFKKHFSYQKPTDVVKDVYDTKNTKENNELVNLLKVD